MSARAYVWGIGLGLILWVVALYAIVRAIA
jgi:hypothetical protein